jgi:hypothetical protein
MTDADRDPFGRHMAVLAETFGEVLTTPRLEGYFLALRDLDLEPVRRAIKTALSACKFFPRPAELRELAGDVPPDVGLIEACLTAHFRATIGLNRMPSHPFLRLVVERLGGPYQAVEMTSFERLQVLRSIVPSVAAMARARGIVVPTCDDPVAIGSAGRGTQTMLPQPEPVARDVASNIHWALPAPGEPASVMTDDDVAARKMDEPEGSA